MCIYYAQLNTSQINMESNARGAYEQLHVNRVLVPVSIPGSKNSRIVLSHTQTQTFFVSGCGML